MPFLEHCQIYVIFTFIALLSRNFLLYPFFFCKFFKKRKLLGNIDETGTLLESLCIQNIDFRRWKRRTQKKT